MKDKKCISDFTHINTRIAKTNLAFPLVQDEFSILASSKCEVLAVIDFKYAFHAIGLMEELKKYCRILPYLAAL